MRRLNPRGSEDRPGSSGSLQADYKEVQSLGSGKWEEEGRIKLSRSTKNRGQLLRQRRAEIKGVNGMNEYKTGKPCWVHAK